jgi:hypothetical protein
MSNFGRFNAGQLPGGMKQKLGARITTFLL